MVDCESMTRSLTWTSKDRSQSECIKACQAVGGVVIAAHRPRLQSVWAQLRGCSSMAALASHAELAVRLRAGSDLR